MGLLKPSSEGGLITNEYAPRDFTSKIELDLQLDAQIEDEIWLVEDPSIAEIQPKMPEPQVAARTAPPPVKQLQPRRDYTSPRKHNTKHTQHDQKSDEHHSASRKQNTTQNSQGGSDEKRLIEDAPMIADKQPKRPVPMMAATDDVLSKNKAPPHADYSVSSRQQQVQGTQQRGDKSAEHEEPSTTSKKIDKNTRKSEQLSTVEGPHVSQQTAASISPKQTEAREDGRNSAQKGTTGRQCNSPTRDTTEQQRQVPDGPQLTEYSSKMDKEPKKAAAVQRQHKVPDKPPNDTVPSSNEETEEVTAENTQQQQQQQYHGSREQAHACHITEHNSGPSKIHLRQRIEVDDVQLETKNDNEK